MTRVPENALNRVAGDPHIDGIGLPLEVVPKRARQHGGGVGASGGRI